MTNKSVVLHGRQTKLLVAVRSRLQSDGYTVHQAESPSELDTFGSAAIVLGVGVDVEELSTNTGQHLCSIAPSNTAKVYEFERLVRARGRKSRRKAYIKLDRLVAHIADMRALQLLV